MSKDLTEIFNRTLKFEDLRSRAKDKTQFAYLELLYNLMVDYDSLDNEKKFWEIAYEIEKVNFKIVTDDKKQVNAILLDSYDRRARRGDFRAYCNTLE